MSISRSLFFNPDCKGASSHIQLSNNDKKGYLALCLQVDALFLLQLEVDENKMPARRVISNLTGRDFCDFVTS